jgi:hypothetical protein
MLKVLICVILATPFSPQTAAVDGPSINFRFENPMFVVPRIEVTLDESGQGRVVFTRKSLNRPIERAMVVRSEVYDQLRAALDRLDFVHSDEVYQSKSEHPNLGTVTLHVTRAGKSREVHFNYTENHDAETVATLMRGIATREIYAFDLQTAARYFPLDTPDLLKALKDDVARKRVTDPSGLVPLLRDLAGNVGIPLIARNKAAELASAFEKEEGRIRSGSTSEKR